MFAQMLDKVGSDQKTAQYATSRSEAGFKGGNKAEMDSEHLTLRSEEENYQYDGE